MMFAPFLRHWNVGLGTPDAATVNEADEPTHAVCGVGCEVMAGPTLTVSEAEALVADEQALATTQS